MGFSKKQIKCHVKVTTVLNVVYFLSGHICMSSLAPMKAVLNVVYFLSERICIRHFLFHQGIAIREKNQELNLNS